MSNPYERSKCPCCGEYFTLNLFEVNGEWICDDCFEDYITQLSMSEIADAMSINHISI